MYKPAQFLVINILLLLFSSFLSAQEKCLSMFVVFNDSSGYININRQMAGYHVDFLNELEAHSGLCINKKLIPYSRALKGLKFGEYDGGIVARTSELGNDIKYLTRLITAKTIIIPKQGLNLTSFQDLSNITIGRFRGVDLNDTPVRDLNLSLVDLYSYNHGLRMLKKGRIDALVGNTLGLSIIGKLNMLNEVNLAGSLVIGKREVWFVASKKKNKARIIEKLQKSSQLMVDNGTVDRILTKYFGKNWKLIAVQ